MGQKREYINEFLYFIVKPVEGSDGTFIYYSGVSISGFIPITKQRHGLCANPAFRGLQLTNMGVRELAKSKGVSIKDYNGTESSGVALAQDTWYSERILIEGALESFPEEVISYGAVNLVKRIVDACTLQGANIPETMVAPDELNVFIENMCKVYGQ